MWSNLRQKKYKDGKKASSSKAHKQKKDKKQKKKEKKEKKEKDTTGDSSDNEGDTIPSQLGWHDRWTSTSCFCIPWVWVWKLADNELYTTIFLVNLILNFTLAAHSFIIHSDFRNPQQTSATLNCPNLSHWIHLGCEFGDGGSRPLPRVLATELVGGGLKEVGPDILSYWDEATLQLTYFHPVISFKDGVKLVLDLVEPHATV